MDSASRWPSTALARSLNVRYPIIQGPFGGFASQRLAAAVSNAGGLGSLGGFMLDLDGLRKAVGEIRALTDKPFAVNLWVSREDPGAFTADAASFARSVEPLVSLLDELGAARPAFQPYAGIDFEVQAQTLIDLRVPAISFIFGVPPTPILDACRANGIRTIGTVTTPDEAIALERAGVDVIVASSFEAGGHRGSFLRASEDSLTGAIALVPQVADAVSIPVAAAGGIGDARGILAALALGADGVQMGTAFLQCEGSGATPAHLDVLRNGRAARTALTRGFTGRLARGVDNALMQAVNQPNVPTLPYPLQRTISRTISAAAEKAGRRDLMSMWAGQSTNLSHVTDAGALIEALAADIGAAADAVLGWRASTRLRTASR
jgi:nitronate monooxygenase